MKTFRFQNMMKSRFLKSKNNLPVFVSMNFLLCNGKRLVKLFITVVIFTYLFTHPSIAGQQDSISHQGIVNIWGGYNPDIRNSLCFGGRFIPQLNYRFKSKGDLLFDFEGSVNLNGSLAIHPFDSVSGESAIRAYRAWARLSGQQFEIRMGLQKINFGSASMLRPLMWFDQIDPRDPLQLTNGVWAILGRYYFLNNTNIWIWGLLGNKGPKTWENGTTDPSAPEFGGRIQSPLMKGEAALSYHFRKAGHNLPGLSSAERNPIPEHRIGIDGKWDAGAGLWFEAAWLHQNGNPVMPDLNNQEMFCLGTDYTFALGNGLNAVLEQLFYSIDSSPFAFENRISLSALSLSYPVGLNSHFTAILYRDWKSPGQYTFVSWQRKVDHFSFYLMGFLNPKNYYLPQQRTANPVFAGKGFHLMLVYNY
jgi:hypothetical protein